MIYIPPLTLFTLFWLIGIGVAPLIEVSVWVWVALGSMAVLAAAVSRNYVIARAALISFAFLTFGAARYLSSQPSLLDPNFIASYNDGDALTIEGIVVDEPDVRDVAINLRLQVESVRVRNSAREVEGVVLIQVPRYPPIEYGARVRAFGVLQTPPAFEDFSYRDFLARQGIYSTMYRARVEVDDGEAKDFFTRLRVMIFKPIFIFKSRAIESILKTFPEPQGALISGILLGVDSNIPESLQNAFRVTGTSHIVAISGFNISIIAGIVSSLFRKIFGERRAIPLAIIAIAVYSIMAGASASVVRAAIMGSLVLLANGFRRPTYGLNSLAVAALVMTLFNPNTLWDVGFQLSASATLGLILYAEP
ncbi:MAG: ComEC/Rec2 family competence protein, partial [Chloroflexi bacterium]|nr:ComEC/Rec2 family competence protein [Chloroflexota bacterium]